MNTGENKNKYLPLLSDLDDKKAQELANSLRQDLIESVSKTGGHFASNLGIVELTVALHRVYNTARDRLVFDVGHQCYVHKMITGRYDEMSTIRQYNGISGFPKPGESIHDAFIAGHASNSVAVAIGMARARTIQNQNYKVIAIIGDGALTGGLSYEGLSIAGQSNEQILVILNDNGMSIAKNVGGVANHLAHQRLKPQYITFKKYYRKFMKATWLGRKVYAVIHGFKTAIKESLLPCSMFEDMGFTYLGPIDGHDMHQLTNTLRFAKEINGPALLHVRTQKGKGYPFAEKTPSNYHGVSAFDLSVGVPPQSSDNFSGQFGNTLCNLAEKNPKICAISAAMTDGTGLEQFAAKYPNRFFDVGIAEGAAVSMAAGMSKQGAIPVFAVYSTFLQRSYDMLIHDISLLNLHTVFAVDRAGLVGNDGETHHGLFDVAFLDTVPNLTVLAPSNFAELDEMMRRAIDDFSSPVAVRYPRGREGSYTTCAPNENETLLQTGKDITIASYGILINTALEVADKLKDAGITASVVKLNTITPLVADKTIESVSKTKHLLVIEDCAAAGSVGIRLCAMLAQAGLSAKTILKNAGNGIVTHGSVSQLYKHLGIDADSIVREVKKEFTDEKRTT